MDTPAIWILAAVASAITLQGCAGTGRAGRPTSEGDPDRSQVASVLDTLHDAASKADERRYFACFAPDAVFLGTDASERWSTEAFRAYAHPIFSQGRGWTYTMTERHVTLSPDGRTAWFDEMLTNAKYGTCRGSGVLTRSPNGPWLIQQYNLSVPIPNDMLADVAEQVRAFERSQKATPEQPR